MGRRGLQPTLRTACGTLLAVCSLGAVTTLPAAGASQPTGLTTVEWSGGLVFSWTVSSSTADPKGIPGNKAVTHLNWDAKAVVTGDDLYNGKPVRWQFSKLEGSYSYDTTEPRAIHCSATLKEKSGYEATNFDLANITYNLGTGEYQVTATAPFDTNALTTGLPQTDPCAEIGASGIPQPGIGDPKAAELGKAITPTESVRPGGPYLFHYNASWQSPDQIDTSSQVSTDLTISAGLTGVSRTPTPSNPTPTVGVSTTPTPPPAADVLDWQKWLRKNISDRLARDLQRFKDELLKPKEDWDRAITDLRDMDWRINPDTGLPEFSRHFFAPPPPPLPPPPPPLPDTPPGQDALSIDVSTQPGVLTGGLGLTEGATETVDITQTGAHLLASPQSFTLTIRVRLRGSKQPITVTNRYPIH